MMASTINALRFWASSVTITTIFNALRFWAASALISTGFMIAPESYIEDLLSDK